jgi:catechol 2,3-dioxygenase-like lactoylglutathione lyase family enzyme
MMMKHSSAKSLFVAAAALLSLNPVLAQGQAPAPASADNPLQLTSDHVTISVADIEKEAAFYTYVLGFKELSRIGKTGDDFQHRTLGIAGVYRIDLSQRKGSVRHTVGTPSDLEQGWRHIVFKTPNLENTLKLLTAKNATLKVNRNKDGVLTEIFVSDPEGNEIELQT